MLSQDRGEIRTEIRSVIQIFDIRTIHAEDVIHADRCQVLDNVVDHPVSPRYGVHAVTADDTCLDFSAMVPKTRCAITTYMDPPASELVRGNRHHRGGRIPLETWALRRLFDDGSRRVLASISSLTTRRHVWCHIRHRREAGPLVAFLGRAGATSESLHVSVTAGR
jgi:hypothetical protein